MNIETLKVSQMFNGEFIDCPKCGYPMAKNANGHTHWCIRCGNIVELSYQEFHKLEVI